MSFPVSISGSLRLPKDAYDRTQPGQIAARLSFKLEQADATTVKLDGNRVSFTVGWARMLPKRNPLNGIDGGTIVVSDSQDALTVRFTIGVARRFWVSLFVLGAVYYAIIHKTPPVAPPFGLNIAGWLALLFVVLTCVGYIATALGFPFWLRRQCRDEWGRLF